jgi:serine/threonine protein kinase
VLRDFEKELGIIKRLSHTHIVQLIGSYTDPKESYRTQHFLDLTICRHVGLIMLPVADCNLADYLNRKNISHGEKSFLRTFYGCLAFGRRYLHDNCIRHKNVIPQVSSRTSLCSVEA